MDHIAFCHIRIVQVLVSQFHERSHIIFGFLEIFLIEAIISICYRLDQLNCFRKEWGKLRRWDEVAEFPESVGNSVLHNFATSVFGLKNIKILLRKLYECCSICRTACILNEITEVAQRVKDFKILNLCMIIQLACEVPVSIVFHDTFSFGFKDPKEVSSDFHHLWRNSRYFSHFFLNLVNILFVKFKVRLGLCLYNHVSFFEGFDHIQWLFNNRSHHIDLLICKEVAHLIVWGV